MRLCLNRSSLCYVDGRLGRPGTDPAGCPVDLAFASPAGCFLPCVRPTVRMVIHPLSLSGRPAGQMRNGAWRRASWRNVRPSESDGVNNRSWRVSAPSSTEGTTTMDHCAGIGVGETQIKACTRALR